MSTGPHVNVSKGQMDFLKKKSLLYLSGILPTTWLPSSQFIVRHIAAHIWVPTCLSAVINIYNVKSFLENKFSYSV